MANERILVIDDEELMRMSLREELARHGYRIEEADTGAKGLARAAESDVDLVMLDYQLPDTDGLQVLKELRTRAPDTLVIMMTAFSSTEVAVKAIKLGAYDYLNKPFDLDEVAMAVEKALETTELRREVRQHAAKLKEQNGLGRMIGKSAAVQGLRDQVRRIAHSGASTVLIRGESGVGKDVLARAIHYESERARAPFMNVTCTALPDNLLESELFGHERGSFTDAKAQKKGLFELAKGGTIFLDEIGDMAAGLQAKLLRFLQDRRFRRVGGNEDILVDVRVIAATNKDLEKAVREGGFRSDLFYRLNVIPLTIPPLRDRPEDIPLLAQAFVDQMRVELKSPITGLTPEAVRALTAYPWPGNIRELRNAIERSMILGAGDRITPADLPPELDPSRGAKPLTEVDDLVVLPVQGVKIEALEHSLVRQALERTHGNQSASARLLGLSRDQLRYRMEQMGLLQPPARRRGGAASPKEEGAEDESEEAPAK